ncbi:EI24 domain-containing protein [Sphingomonas sp. BIUV-7]|uniref:EI24 domain-containing protein n=1 Tax=Sphingomonas natans TaxID=3063330 RepID=A0ABT8Y4G7_9SPHN|nr:EI24 domain-containing protein [Sphingomonas sp. BIUV-7]MDO6413216.1 EI24 domain-containing protein [Sphingomonas sp. BIUV-7]
MLRVLPLSLIDLTQPRILAILFRSLFVTLLIFLGLGIGAVWALDGADPCLWWSGQSCEFGLSASGLGALVITVLGIWLLFPAVALGVIAAYSDRIVATVEALHYPDAAAAARPAGVGGGLVLGLRSAGRLLVYNLIALPFYLLLLVTGVGTIVLFVLVNGVAIGRDFGEMVAARHGDGPLRREWLRATRGERAAIGIIITSLFLVPIVNLIAPLLGATMATHLFHRDASATPR